jgi:hypothetical protein
VHTCNPSHSGGWGRRISCAQDFEKSLGNTARPTFQKKISHVWWHTPIIPVLGRLRHKTQEVEAKFKEQPEILSKMLSQKMLNK